MLSSGGKLKKNFPEYLAIATWNNRIKYGRLIAEKVHWNDRIGNYFRVPSARVNVTFLYVKYYILLG